MKKKTLVGLAFASPWIVGFIAFGLFPTVMSLYYSLTHFNILQAPRFIGFSNFVAMVHDPLFWTSVYNTLYITVIGVPSSIVLGVLAALLLNQRVRGVGMFRTLIYLPSIVPPVAVTIVFMFILNPDYGLLNAILAFFRLPQPGWLADPSYSKLSLVFMAVWQSGQVIVIMLAGLQEVPRNLYEATRLDGAGPLRTFFSITLPMLSPVIFYNVVTGIFTFLQFFTQAFVATAKDLGTPAHSTLFYTIYMYQNAFQYLKMGYASAMAWGLLIITLALTYLVFRVGNRTVYYGGE